MTAASSAFDPIDFLDSAVRIQSHEDVTEMRDVLVETLSDHGVDPLVDDAGNTLATKGSGSPHVVLNTHIDTVSPHVPYDREDGVIHGRGSCDAKGPLAAILSAFLAFDADAHDGRLTLAITPDEEVYSTGAAALDLTTLSGVSDPTADAYIVGEPTGLDVCTAAKGRFEGTIDLSGRNAHAAEPESGVNAVAAAEGALEAIRTFDADRDPHPDLGPATLTPTVIEGGEATNQVPADCAITVDRRSVPPESADGFRAGLETAVDDATPESVGVDFELTERPTPFLEAFATDADEPVVRHLAAAAERVTDGAAGTVRPFTAATEASYFAPAPTVVFGPGVLADDAGPVAHADREYVRVAEVERAATALSDALSALFG
ncbi:M20 family metallopeptidase [Haloplanus aerogenes]|uniref:Acetylornithine deacetylase n=1 Tax=Haloplanus aerogenes TaxID=660522 RepID=A0A3M0EBD7_9EURY|nr:M20 family metallopeptidase [Haloplanus aerogenes]AZH25589.1 M20/M25/M40 family metallo-hydrolase [Haloplanus aerogenes]RMB25310.1 acetylornithine deacetylase [Haloplanus aerogenes]